tara:strand:+ start:710 stop:1540 length:831 start_codon:yes stop_codon:yes gene_type:complete
MLRKILKILKTTTQVILVMALGFAISLGVLVSVQESSRFPTAEELNHLDNISKHLEQKEYLTVKKSRNSVLLVLSSSSNRDGFASMSGTYLTHDDKYYVLTAAHGILGECDRFFVATSDEEIYNCIKYIEINQRKDYAIIEIEHVEKREPLQIKKIIPKNNQWKSELAVLNGVFYTGYPNSLGPLTFEGSVAGISKDQHIYLHSYAWPGSSGSGVFSREGNLVGIVLALNVGFTSAGYDVLEDLVIILPLFKINWDPVYENQDLTDDTGNTGDTAE